MVTATNIPKGYKQTEVGLIPEDWDVKRLKNIVSDIIDNRGRTPPYTKDESIELIETASISFVNQFPDYTKVTKFVSKQVFDYWFRGHPLKGDILISTVGEYSGSSAFMNETRGTIAQNLIAIRINEVDPFYTFCWTRSNCFRTQLNQVMMNQAQPSLRVPWLMAFFIQVPPTKAEQEAIGRALSDADTLIESLEKLITKKRNIKQAAMQQLLTGKKRLPGFSGKWETKKMGEIGEITGAGVDKKSKSDEIPVRLVNYLDVFHRYFIYSKELNHWVTAPPTKAQKCAVQKGDIFFTPSSETREDIGISAVAMEHIPDTAYSYHVVRLRLFEDWDLVFRTYIFKTRYFLDQAEMICEGSGKRYVISLTRFREMNICYPPSKDEQSAISKILFDMDAEIEELEKKRDKYKMIKQGMMQELLTGKTRLI